MAPKQQLDKQAWSWTDNTDPSQVTNKHIETAYRINLKSCDSKTCRRNCKGNPNCLIGLGEKEWLGEISDEQFHNIDDPNLERKEKNSFVGLKNLGATCYANSLLQLWFHNPAFRRAIYKWKRSEDPQEMAEIKLGENGDSESYQPVSVVGQLQYIFALLQYSNRRYIDPSPFIKCLGLNTDQQQDAQEFCKLFISLLEDKLQYQSNAKVRNMVQDQFKGVYEYVVKCSKCQQESSRRSAYYELDLNLKGHKDLDECIREFLQEEKLEGANQYFCSVCNSKQDAGRRIRLKKLPPVLHLQLLRFVFDRQTGYKKKLNTHIKFPEVLDLGKYMETNNAQELKYNLSAVLIHNGQSANSGHYIAHIKHRASGLWSKFNDDQIERMDTKTLKLGIEDDDDKTKVPGKLGKGFYSSKSAYMFVYTLAGYESEVAPADDSDEWDIPEVLQQEVAKDNSKFEDWIKEMIIMMESNIENGKAKHYEIKQLYESLPARKGEDFEWMSTSWLVRWLKNDQTVTQIDNTNALCPHNKLHPDAVTRMKCISKFAADQLYEKFDGGPRLSRKDCCKDCVVERCKLIQIKIRLQLDAKAISNSLKFKISTDEVAFWVGKRSLRCWQQQVLQQYQSAAPAEKETNGHSSPKHDDENNGVNEKKQGEEPAAGSEEEGDDEDGATLLGFNEDIVCSHGGLTLLDTSRRLVSESLWTRLKSYFPNCREFPHSKPPCPKCALSHEEQCQMKDVYKKLALEQKAALSDLYQDKNRPSMTSLGSDPVYIVSAEFVDLWRKFVRDGGRREPVHCVKNSALICCHGLFMYKAEDPNGKFALVWEKEWELIRKEYEVDTTIALHHLVDFETNKGYNIYSPEICDDCLKGRIRQEEHDMLNYSLAKIYVRKIESSKASGGEESDTEISGTKKRKLEADPDVQATEIDTQALGLRRSTRARRVPGKKQITISSSQTLRDLKLQNPGPLGDSEPDVIDLTSPDKSNHSNLKMESNSDVVSIDYPVQNVRRNPRPKRNSGTRQLQVTSSQSLLELKLQIMNIFGAIPSDQHILYEGNELTNNSSTLAALRVMPDSELLVKVDEPSTERLDEDYLKDATPEEGFKGTELMR